MALVAPGRYRLPTRPSTRATVDGETTGSKLGPYRLLGKQATPLSSQATAPPSMTQERERRSGQHTWGRWRPSGYDHRPVGDDLAPGPDPLAALVMVDLMQECET